MAFPASWVAVGARGLHLGAIATLLAAAALGASAGPAVSAPAATPAWVSDARLQLAQLRVKPLGPDVRLDREKTFGDWKDLDHDGCDTRNEILHRDLTGDVPRKDCPLLRGTLRDPYTSTTIKFNRAVSTQTVQVDHIVALKNAWRTGASKWTFEQRVAFANDPAELIAVQGSANSSKGAKDASEWRPNTRYECAYVAAQIAIKKRYRLWVTREERDAMKDVLAGCGPRPGVLVVLR